MPANTVHHGVGRAETAATATSIFGSWFVNNKGGKGTGKAQPQRAQEAEDMPKARLVCCSDQTDLEGTFEDCGVLNNAPIYRKMGQAVWLLRKDDDSVCKSIIVSSGLFICMLLIHCFSLILGGIGVNLPVSALLLCF